MRSTGRTAVALVSVVFLIHSNIRLLASDITASERTGGERRFAVMLAIPTKSVEGGPGGLDLPNPDDIWDQYFDYWKNSGPDRVDSFAEFWYEISYGNVSVAGDVFGWVEVPWPVIPAGEEPPLDGKCLPYTDLNASGMLELFQGEMVPASQLQAILIDYNGDAEGTGHPDYPGHEHLDIPTNGLVDFDLLTGRPVWTPGERFLDVDGDGRYDALLEGNRDGWGEANCERDGYVGADEICDDPAYGGDADGYWDFPEPFGDFLVIYDPTATHPDNRWIKLDPSAKNLDSASRAWAEAYIRANYPGDADALIARCGNDKYDGPDDWVESASEAQPFGSKMQQEAAAGMYVSSAITPRPDDPALQGYWDFQWDFDAWWQEYWTDKHIEAGFDPNDPNFPPAPSPPEWEVLIPNMQRFDPANASRGELTDPNDPLRTKAFYPNCGGTSARLHQDPNDPNSWCQPDLANLSDGCRIDPNDPSSPPDLAKTHPDPGSTGDGSLDTTNNHVSIGAIRVLPDMLDRNGDGVLDCYDGPAEFDDLPSSIYHARSVSGLGYGGDGRLGGVTSPQNTAPYGDDIGTGTPGSPGGPDGLIPAGGPLAYRVHGSSGYDAGNVLNLEYLTWRATPTAPVVALAYKISGSALYGVDVGLDHLVAINVDTAAPSPVGPLGVSDIVAMSDHPDGDKLYAIRTVREGAAYVNRLYEVNVNSGASTMMNPGIDGVIWGVDTSEPLFFPVDDTAYHTGSGTLYATVGFPEDGYTELWAIDPSTGAAQWVFEDALGVRGTRGLAYGDGQLYTIDMAFEWLATIDLTAPPPRLNT